MIIYVLDALRADHLSCYGYERETSPHIDALAREGVVFENCFTPATWTRPVAASILTGVYPGVHKVQTRLDKFSPSVTRLPELLQASGFRTAAFSAIGQVSSETGFDRGFDGFLDLYKEPSIRDTRGKSSALSYGEKQEVAMALTEDINRFLFPWLKRNKANNAFALAWSIDTHDPYIPPEGFDIFVDGKSRGENNIRLHQATQKDVKKLVDLYDSVIYYVDYGIAQLIDRLKALELYDDSMIIITSDHGEAFYEHGFFSHGTIPYDELIRVPLIIKFPDSIGAGQRIDSLTQLIDIFPTILRVAGIEYDSSLVQGRDLLSLVEEREDSLHFYVYSETQSLPFLKKHFSVRNHHWKYICTQFPKWTVAHLISFARYALRHRLWSKFLANPSHLSQRYGHDQSSEKLFCLDADESETNNLATSKPQFAMCLRERIKTWQADNEHLADRLSSQPYSFRESQAMRRHLEELGYL